MTVPIADLDFHPWLIARIERRFGTCCCNPADLMILAAFACADKHDQGIEAHHDDPVHKVAGIAKRRPQRVLTINEFAVFLHEFKGELSIREVQWTGGSLVSTRAEQNFVKAMTPHSRAATAALIGSAA